MGSGRDGARAAAGALLHELLTGEDRYREMWWAHRAPSGGQELNQRSVLRVMAQHLCDEEELPAIREEDWVRSRASAMSRLMAGHPPKHDTTFLPSLMDAFDMSRQHRAQLEVAFYGVVLDRAAGDAAPPVAPSSDFWTVNVLEEHFVDHRGMPGWHRSTRTIEALREGLDQIDYRFDTDCAQVAVLDGGWASDATLHRGDPDGVLWRVEVALDAPPMRAGERRTVQYVTFFDYDVEDPPAPLFRRGGARSPDGRTTAVEVAVTFDQAKLPAVVERCLWAPRSAVAPLMATPVRLGPDHDVVTEVGTTVEPGGLVGFRWLWHEETAVGQSL